MTARVPAVTASATRAFPVSVKGVVVQAGKVLLLENERAGLFGPGEVPRLAMPDGYKRSVAAWFTRLDGGQPQATR